MYFAPYATLPEYASDAAAEAAYTDIQAIADVGYTPWYYNTTSSIIRIYSAASATWGDYSGGASSGDLLADGTVPMTANFDLDSNKIVNLGNGTSSGDAVNYAQLQAAIQGYGHQEDCRIATVADLSATYDSTGGTSTNGSFVGVATAIDGYALNVNDRVLVKDQTNEDENGIYVVTVASGTVSMERAANFDSDGEVNKSAIVYISEGSLNATSSWILQTDDPITVGGVSGDDIVWVTFSRLADTGIVSLTANTVPLKSSSTNALTDSSLTESSTHLVTGKPTRETIPAEVAQDTADNITINANLGNVFRYTHAATGPITVTYNAITNEPGTNELQSISVFIKNKSASAVNLTLAFNSSWIFVSGSAPTGIDTTDDILVIEGHMVNIDGTDLFICNATQVSP